MFLQITFKAFPRTVPIYLKRTFNFPVFTNSLVLSDVVNGEEVKAAVLPVNARVLLFSDYVFQNHIPDL
jgi:hypothetical protein